MQQGLAVEPCRRLAETLCNPTSDSKTDVAPNSPIGHQNKRLRTLKYAANVARSGRLQPSIGIDARDEKVAVHNGLTLFNLSASDSPMPFRDSSRISQAAMAQIGQNFRKAARKPLGYSGRP